MTLANLLLLMMTSLLSLAQDRAEEIDKRLEYIRGEKATIEKRIQGGQDRALFQKYMDDFNSEESQLIAEKKQLGQKKKPVPAARASRSRATVSQTKANQELSKIKKDIRYLIF